VSATREPAQPEQPAQRESSSGGYRPYPGSDSPGEANQKITPAGFKPDNPQQASEADDLAKKVRNSSGNMEAEGDLSRPAMAPSLKKRGEKRKKRGFFKRLFGIK
jgi:hypothetical protein